MSVLQTNQPCSDHVVVLGSDQSLQLLDIQYARFSSYRVGDEPRQLCERPLLVVIHMAIGFAQELAAPVAVDANGNLVGHRSAGHEDRGFFTEQFGGHFFQSIDGGIDVNHGIADLGIGHGGPHFRGWSGNGIAAKIDHGRPMAGQWVTKVIVSVYDWVADLEHAHVDFRRVCLGRHHD